MKRKIAFFTRDAHGSYVGLTLTIIAGGLLLGSVAAVSASREWRANTSKTERPESIATKFASDAAVNPSRSTPSFRQQASRIEAEVITIRPSGFEPQEIIRPKGLFLLAVENRSGLQAVQLSLEREAGAKLREVQIPKNKHDWNDGFDLTPGRYILREAHHPGWTCSITITAK